MKKNFSLTFIIIIFTILSLFLIINYSNKNNKTNDENSNLILFYGQGCPHCTNVEKFLIENNIQEKISIEKKEVYYNQKNANLLINVAKKCGFNDNEIGVPFLWDKINNKCIVGDKPIITFLKEKI